MGWLWLIPIAAFFILGGPVTRKWADWHFLREDIPDEFVDPSHRIEITPTGKWFGDSLMEYRFFRPGAEKPDYYWSPVDPEVTHGASGEYRREVEVFFRVNSVSLAREILRDAIKWRMGQEGRDAAEAARKARTVTITEADVC